jgi:hypothetical protein
MSHGLLSGILGGTSPTHMCSYTKDAAGWLRYVSAQLDREYVLTALENQTMGDMVLTLDDPQSDDYYIIGARDSDVFFGAPESGVVVYHITYDDVEGHAVVDIVNAHGQGDADAGSVKAIRHATLHHPAQHEGATECTLSGGLAIRLLSESQRPYQATVRIERYEPNALPLPQPGPRP